MEEEGLALATRDRLGIGLTGRLGSTGISARCISSSITRIVTDGRGTTLRFCPSALVPSRACSSESCSRSSSVAVFISWSELAPSLNLSGRGGTGGGKLNEGLNAHPLALGVPNSKRPSAPFDLVGVPGSFLNMRATSRAGVSTPPSTTRSKEV